MRVRSKVQLPTAPIGYVRVELRRREVGVPEHLLNAAKVGAAFEQMGGEAVAEEVGVDPGRLEACRLGEPTEDEEGTGAGQRAAPRVEEELRSVPHVEVRAAVREVAAESLGGLPSDRNDPLLLPFADYADEPVVEVDAGLVEANRLRHAQARAVEQLDEGAVAAGARQRPVGGGDQPLRLGD